MRHAFSPLVLIGVACAVPFSAAVLAQVEKGESAPKAAALPAVKTERVAPSPTLEPSGKDEALDAARKEAVATARKRAAVLLELRKTAVVQGVVTPAQAVQGNMDTLVKQWTRQFRPILRMEYHFARTVCEMTKEQRVQIAREGERALKDVATKYAEEMLLNSRGRVVAGSRVVSTPFDFRGRLQEGLANAVKIHLAPEQATRYRAEIGLRNAHTKRVLVRILVAKLDQDLMLTVEQGDQIGKSLVENWDESWCPSLETALNIDHYFPPIPDRHVVPFLSPGQKKSWDATQVTRRTIRFGATVPSMMDDDPLEDEELVEARKAQAQQEETKK